MLGVREEGEGGEKSAAMLGVVGEWQARRCLRGWVCGGEGSGGLVELFVGVVGGGDLVVEWCLVQNNDRKRKTAN